MSKTSHFETMSSGMEAKLNPRSRILKNDEHDDYSRTMRELDEIGSSMGLHPLRSRRKIAATTFAGKYL